MHTPHPLFSSSCSLPLFSHLVMEQTQQETHQHHQNQPQQAQQEDSSTGSSSKSSFLCRQSSTRWTPTTDQIRILKDLYYNNGVRSPSAEQIQRISARLRQYGKIEGKNVFYWFQNHKARERQKKRFSVDMAMHRGGVGWKPDDNSNMLHQTTKYTSISPGVSGPSSPPSPNLLVGQMGNIGYGSVHMEKSFRDCSISPGCSGAGGTVSNNFGWVGVDPYTTTPYSYPMLDSIRPIQFFKEPSPEIETLPLFPMHGEDSVNTHQYNPNWFRSDKEITGSRTSLELTLNSYSNNKSI